MIDAAFETVARLGMHAVPARGAPHAARREVGAFEEHACGVRVDLAVRAAHDARERGRPFSVRDHEIIRVEFAILAVERLQGFARRGAAHEDLVAAHVVQIKRVHRLPVLEQHEVRHVDDVRDRTNAEALQPVTHPRGRGADRHAEHEARAVPRATLGVVDPHGHVARHGLALGEARGRLRRGLFPRQVEERRDLAGEADVAERVRTVGGQTKVEDVVVHLGHGLAERCARRGEALRQDQDPRVLVLARDRGEPELALGAEHALADDTADLARRERHVHGRQVRPEGREGHEAARLGHVRRAADDALLGAAAVDRDELELCSRRVRFVGLHLGHDERLRALAELGDRLDLDPGVRQTPPDLLGRSIETGDELANPAVRGLHDPCGLKRMKRPVKLSRPGPQNGEGSFSG